MTKTDAQLLAETQAQQEQERLARVQRWDEYTLPTTTVHKRWQHVDAVRNARRAADNSGMPQRLLLLFDGGKTDVIEPNLEVAKATGALERMAPHVKALLGVQE